MKKQLLSKEQAREILFDTMNNSTTGEFEGESFLIVSGWQEIEDFQEVLKQYYIEEDDQEQELELEDILEYIGMEKDAWGFDDEYSTCNNCYKIIRTSPTHYGWMPNFIYFDHELICGECIREDSSEYLEYILNNPEKANTILDPEVLEKEGYKKHNGEYESGLHIGMDDDPKKVFAKLKDKYNVIFHLYETSQFYITWHVYTKEKEEEDI